MENKMKKFVDYIMAQPVWKVVLYGLGILFMIFNPEIILPILFFGGIGFAWYFAKKKPNATKRNIAAIASVLAVGGAYLINPNIASTKQEEQTQATHFASTPSKKDENAKKEAETKREKEAEEKEKAEKEKAEKEKKSKEEQERKEREEREKKAKEEQERKEKEERDKKEAEAKQLAAQAEAAVQALENNQVTENIAPAQAAIANVADQGTKDRLTHRVGLVQNAINVRAQQAAEAERARQAAAAEQARQAAAAEQARQAAAAQQAQQQQVQNQTVSGGGYYRDASGRWHRPNGQFASKKEIANIGLAW